VAVLAPFFDEIELVLFESKDQENLPDEEEIYGLKNCSILHSVGFNVHLPIDIFLGDESEEVRSKGVSIVKKVIERTICLAPSVYILHFDQRDKSGHKEIENWQKQIKRSAEEILQIRVDPYRIAIETLSYPFGWIEDIINEFGFSICLDIGHILTSGRDLPCYLERYLSKTSMIHLHGFANGVDHLGIDRLPGETLKFILSRLRDYNGIVSIEVFSIDDLRGSLILMEEKWEKR
jgi:sugar phosphate isomerase/epimerase